MKKFFIISACLLFAMTTFAQKKTFTKADLLKFKDHHLYMMLNVVSSNASAKTTAIEKRIKAASTYDVHNFTVPKIEDTTHYQYTGNRGSKFNFDWMVYDGHYQPDFPVIYPYDFVSIGVYADSILTFTRQPGVGIQPFELLANTFTATNKLEDQKNYFSNAASLDDGVRNIVLYNGNQQPQFIYSLNLDNVTLDWDTASRDNFYYDAQGRLIADTSFSYDFGDYNAQFAIVFSYLPNGNVDKLEGFLYDPTLDSWSAFLEFDHTFYPNKNLKTLTTSLDFSGGGNLLPYSLDTFTYTGNNTFFTSFQEFIDQGSGFEPSERYLKTLNAANLPDTFYHELYNSSDLNYETDFRASFIYNADKLPINAYEYEVFDSLELSTVSAYYYEDYQTTSIINPIPQANVLIYPNPAIDEINLRWREGIGQQVNIVITSAIGQKVQAQSFKWLRGEEAFSLKGIAPGIYFLQMKDAKGNILFGEKIVKE